ncbi:MAG: hypothetical protein J5923_01285 [Acidaminococcaceae bacterium]|nr:hypothetical protein [Acidaminococcaceae bacterium]
MLKKGKKILCIMALAVLAVGGCSGEKKETDAVFRVGVPHLMATYDHTKGFDGWSTTRIGVGQTVVRFDAEGKLVPWLADFDGNVFTVKDVKFSDGSKVTAKDICDSLTNSCEKNVRARDVMKQSRWKVLADNKFEYIGEKSILTDPLFCIAKGNLYTGGKVISYDARKAVVERNGRKYEYIAIGDSTTRGMSIETGEVDAVFDVNPLYYKNREHEEVGGARTIMGRLNMRPGRPLSDPKLRKTLAECIDLASMEKALRGYVLCNPNYSRYTKSNRAYKPGKADKPATLELLFYDSRPEFKIIAEATQMQAKAAGIDIKLKNVHVNALRDMELSGDFDIVLSSTTNIQSGTVENYYRLYFDSASPENTTKYSNPAFDAAKSLQEMQDVIDKDYAVIVYGNPLHNRVSKKKLAKLNPLDFYYDVDEVK